MEWDSKAVAEFIRMPLAKSAKENAKIRGARYLQTDGRGRGRVLTVLGLC